ncbi:MAG: TIR domain-containing protein [Anaerolineae bacterium]|nr:TIR domain-containing protein [Anaerolineae bacterium]
MSSEASLRIFISYSRTDEAFARQLAARLEQDGAEIWLDVDDIPAGANWSNAIQEGLRLCQVMILIFSPESLASPNVETEWQDFFDNRKPIIPVVHRPVQEEDIHFQIRRRQRVDFSQQRFDAAYQQLVSQLKPFSTQSTPAHNAAQPATPSTAPPPRIGLTRGRIAAILSVIAIVVIGLLLANRVFPPSSTPTENPRVNAALTETFSAQTQIAAAITPSSTTAPTSTATATITPTAPDPNDLAAQIFATRTANAQETLDAYTDTPTITLTFTPDFQLSAEAIVAVTDTAIAVASFSKTPTVTATFMPFHTATPTFTLTSTPTFTWTPTATLTPTLDRGAERMINGIAYVYVPAGCFLMGSPESDQDAKENEKPQHNVCLTHAY